MYRIAFALLVFSWLQLSHFPPWMSWHSEMLTFLAILTLLWHSAWTARRTDTAQALQIPMAAVPFLSLAVIVWAHWASGLLVFFGDALVLSAYLFLSIASLSVGFTKSVTNETKAELLAVALTIGALFSAVIAFVQVEGVWETCFCINPMPFPDRPGGNLGQPNQLATLLVMGLGSVIFLYESNRLAKFSSVLIGLILILAMAATASRTGVLSVAVLTAWWFAKHVRINSKLPVWSVLASFLLGLLFFFWFWPQLVALLMQTPPSAPGSSTVAYNRWTIWPQLIEAIGIRPWRGWGVGQVSTAHNAVIDHYAVSEPYTYAHNIVLDLALGIGLPLTLLLVLVVGVWLWRRVRAVNTMETWFCIAVAIPVAVHSMLEFPFAYAYFVLPVMFAFGILERRLGNQAALQIGPKALIFGLSVLTAVLVWSTVEYIAIEEDFRVVRFESFRVGATPRDYKKPDVVLLTQLDALLDAGRIHPRPGMPQEEIDLARKVALHYPWLATQNRYALSLALNGNSAEANRQLKVIRAQRGEKIYAQIKEAWTLMAKEKYPQLLDFQLP